MDLGNSISLLFCIPFLGMLLSIAVFPLVKPLGGREIRSMRLSHGHYCF